MDLSLLLGAPLIVAAGGILPWISGEAVVTGAAVLARTQDLPLLVGLCALAQMTSKLALYGVVRWAPERMPRRARALLGRIDGFRERRALLAAAVLTGAAVAVPPFYLVTLACGLLRVPVALFALAGLGGTLTRYGLLAWAAHTLSAG